MQVSEIQKIKAQINSKIEKGDYITLGKMLCIAQEAARKRYLRDKEDAVQAMRLIVATRENLIENYPNLKKD